MSHDKPGTDWKIFTGQHQPHDRVATLPPPPPWRPFRVSEVPRERPLGDAAPPRPATEHRGRTFQLQPGKGIVETVNAALLLRRPLLVTGHPGTGKSSLIDAIAYELKLGEPLRWSVTSRSTLRDALYSYDAVARLQASQQLEHEMRSARQRPAARKAALEIGHFLRLGPLGTALLPTDRPRALLVDEIDKADLDLPNDLLNVLEEGEFDIPELARLQQTEVEVRVHGGEDDETYPVRNGRVRAKQFPLVVFTSNGEREFPPAFKRRCLSLDMPDPTKDRAQLLRVVEAHLAAHLDDAQRADVGALVDDFVSKAESRRLATDQLLNAVRLVVGRAGLSEAERTALLESVLRPLG